MYHTRMQKFRKGPYPKGGALWGKGMGLWVTFDKGAHYIPSNEKVQECDQIYVFQVTKTFYYF